MCVSHEHGSEEAFILQILQVNVAANASTVHEDEWQRCRSRGALHIRHRCGSHGSVLRGGAVCQVDHLVLHPLDLKEVARAFASDECSIHPEGGRQHDDIGNKLRPGKHTNTFHDGVVPKEMH